MALASNSKVNFVLINKTLFLILFVISYFQSMVYEKIEVEYSSTSTILLCPIEIVKISNVQCSPANIKCWNYSKPCFSLKNKSNISEVYRKKLYFKWHGQNIILNNLYHFCLFNRESLEILDCRVFLDLLVTHHLVDFREIREILVSILLVS